MKPGSLPKSDPTPSSKGAVSRWRKGLLWAIGFAIVGAGAYTLLRYIRAGEDRHRASIAIDGRDFSTALRYLEESRDGWPMNRETLFLTARTARRAENYEKAERYLDDCARSGGDERAVLLERALIKAQRGDWQLAEGFLLDRVRSNDPDSLLVLEVIAPRYAKAFDYSKAMETLESWIRLDPANATPHLEKGKLVRRLFRNTEALDEFREATRLAPDSIEARKQLSELLVETKEFGEALAHLDWLVERGSADHRTFVHLANCRAGLGQVEAARQILVELATRAPDDPDILAESGKLELDGGRPVQAEPFLRRAAELAPFDRGICFQFARCLEQVGKPAEAEKYRKKTKQIEDSLKRMEELMQAIGQNPRDPALRREAGSIMLSNGQDRAGVRWLETSLEQDPNDIPTHQALAEYYRRTGNRVREEFHRHAANRKNAKG